MQTNPAATGGLDFGAILDKSLQTWGTVQKIKNERDAMRYASAPGDQFRTLHESEAATTNEAYQTGNAPNPAGNRSTVGGYIDQIPKPLLYGSLGLLGVGLLMKAMK